MIITRTNLCLTVILFGVVALTVLSRVDYSQPNIEVLPDMKYSPAWSAYSINPHFRNGRTLQPPVAATIARGEKRLYFEPTPEDAVRAGEELLNPTKRRRLTAAEQSSEAAEPADETSNREASPRNDALDEQFSSSVERGRDAYRVYCACCHGPGGVGDGLVAQRGFPPPPSLLTGKSLAMKDGQIFHILTYGQGNMAKFSGQLSPAQRWDLINFVRELQQQAAPPAESVGRGPHIDVNAGPDSRLRETRT